MTAYEAGLPVEVAFPPAVAHSLAEELSRHGWRQLHVAETEKYAHVTYFFNGGVEEAWPGEERILVPSQKVATYDLAPEMSAAGVTDAVVAGIESDGFDFIVANYANADMVGHTGVWDATVRAVETIDGCLARVARRDDGRTAPSRRAGGGPADHRGPRQCRRDARRRRAAGDRPFAQPGADRPGRALGGGSNAARRLLADVAPTILEGCRPGCPAGLRDPTKRWHPRSRPASRLRRAGHPKGGADRRRSSAAARRTACATMPPLHPRSARTVDPFLAVGQIIVSIALMISILLQNPEAPGCIEHVRR